MIKVILIDDEPLARTVLKEYLLAYPEIEVVQECGDGFEGVKAINQHKPDLIFLDIHMPNFSGLFPVEDALSSTSPFNPNTPPIK